jgi:VanZ family protein
MEASVTRMTAILKSGTNNRPPRAEHYMRTLLLRLARIATWSGIVTITVLSLLPGSERPHTGLPGQVEHFLTYACTGLAASFGYLSFRERVIFWTALGAASGFFELIQAWIPDRSSDVRDALASTVGLTAGLLLGAGFAALILKRYCADWPAGEISTGT